MKKLAMRIFLVLIAVVAVWCAGPYWSLYQINQAVEQHRADQLSSYIDYPQVKASLKPQVQQRLQQLMGFEASSSAPNVLGQLLTDQLSDKMLDVLLTPESIALLMQGKAWQESIRLPDLSLRLPQTSAEQWTVEHRKTGFSIFPRAHAQQVELAEAFKPSLDIRSGFHRWKRFVVKVPTQYAGLTEFELQPRNWRWKIVAIRLDVRE